MTGKNQVAAVSAVVHPKPPSCHQQYETWARTTTPVLRKMSAALTRVEHLKAASQHEAFTQLKRGVKFASRDATLLRRSHAMPRCADPAGYYDRSLSFIILTDDELQSASGLIEMMEALVPLQHMMASEHSLAQELDRTVGVQR